MFKKMDVNFAFAILLLVAAIVGMYFWLDNENVEVEDIYEGTNEVKIESRVDTGEMSEDEMEGKAEDGVKVMDDEVGEKPAGL